MIHIVIQNIVGSNCVVNIFYYQLGLVSQMVDIFSTRKIKGGSIFYHVTGMISCLSLCDIGCKIPFVLTQATICVLLIST